MDQDKLDLIEVLTAQDGQYNDELQAYITAYPLSNGDEIIFEIEYVDPDNEFEVIKTTSHSIFLTRE